MNEKVRKTTMWVVCCLFWSLCHHKKRALSVKTDLFIFYSLPLISLSFPVVSKVSKQLVLLEAEKQRLQEELEDSRREAQKNMREVQVLQARLKDSVTWDEHCNIAGKLRRYRLFVSFYQINVSLKVELISY